jgi:hypothetical protein
MNESKKKLFAGQIKRAHVETLQKLDTFVKLRGIGR